MQKSLTLNVPRKNTREWWIFPLRLLKKGSLKPPQYAHNCLHTVFMWTLVFGLKSRHESNENPYTYLETTVVSISHTSYNIQEVYRPLWWHKGNSFTSVRIYTRTFYGTYQYPSCFMQYTSYIRTCVIMNKKSCNDCIRAFHTTSVYLITPSVYNMYTETSTSV